MNGTPPAVLFVSNGHGEAAIAARIAQEARALGPLRTEHFGLVGERLGGGAFPDVGPQRAMPSGGLVAMGNVRAFARDLGAGFAGLLARLRPEVAVIEVGARNRFGHPHPDTLRALRASVPSVLRTDRDGDVTVSLERGGVRVRRGR